MPARTGPPAMAGRWSRLPDRDLDPTRRAAALADLLLERHGVVTRGAVMAEGVDRRLRRRSTRCSARWRSAAPPGAATSSRAWARPSSRCPGAVDRLRALAEPAELAKRAGAHGRGAGRHRPGQPVRRGAALARPRRRQRRRRDRPRRPATGPGRKAGALVVLVGGDLILYVERGGRTLLSFTDDPEALIAAGQALAGAVRSGALGAMSVERADGESVHASPLRDALTAAGFRATPRGLRLRG